MSNLFEGWPKDKIAVASNVNLSVEMETSVCDTYYQLGYNDRLHPFPLSIILPKIQCGILPVNTNAAKENTVQKATGNSYKIMYKFLAASMHFFGAYNLLYKLKIT